MFQPTWLYVKRHKATGLLYFGKTTKDHRTYHGSGHYWIRHIKTHGDEIETIWSRVFYDRTKLVAYATVISKRLDIVNSEKWANLIPENGLDGGGNVGIPATLEARKKNSESHRDQIPWNKGKSMSEKQKEKMHGPKSEAHCLALRKPKSRTENMKGPRRILICKCGFTDLCTPFTRYHKPKCSLSS